MTQVSWSRHGDRDCIRLKGLASDGDKAATVRVQVRTQAAPTIDGLPAMAGQLVRDADDICFVPRFAFVEGTAYVVVVDGDGDGDVILVRARPNHPATTEVVGIYPTAIEVPRNLLRLYVCFSAAMSEGFGGSHVRLLDVGGDTIDGAPLRTEHELWDAARRRLTVLLDPARIKRGLVPHRQAGYPLRRGASVRLVVDDGFCDARGIPLRAPAEREYHVIEDQRQRVDPHRWVLSLPPAGTRQPLEVRFDRALDHGLLLRCLGVIGPDRRRVEATQEVGPQEQSWRLTPIRGWLPGTHHLVVNPVLEDLAGNSVRRVFDRDLTSVQDDPGSAEPVTVAFQLS